MLVKLDHLPRDRGENSKKYLKPPPSLVLPNPHPMVSPNTSPRPGQSHMPRQFWPIEPWISLGQVAMWNRKLEIKNPTRWA